jgi:acyl carrier protein
MSDVAAEVESIVLAVHRRNGGTAIRLDFDLRLLDTSLTLDSLDLAEIIVALERRFHFSLFDSLTPPRTWADALRLIEEKLNHKG